MRTGRKFLWLSLLAAVLVAFLLSPDWLLAQEDKVELNLRLVPEYYDNEIVPEKGKVIFLEVKNNGTKAITNIRFDAHEPEGWLVDFRPGSIDYLSAGSSQTVNVNIVPSRSTGKGNYTVTLIAEAKETRAATTTFLRVESGSSFWLWVGAGVAALVIAGFLLIFIRFGRE